MLNRFGRALVGIAILGLAGCGGSSKSNTYPPDVEQSFLSACEKATSKASCACQLHEFKKKYTYDEFKALDTQARGDESDRRAVATKVVEITQRCSKKQ
jgi:hypothetical protein